MNRPAKRWQVLVAYVTAWVFAAGSIQYANYVDTKSNQQWCELFVVLDGAYTAEPPKTETGKLVAEKIRRLEDNFDC